MSRQIEATAMTRPPRLKRNRQSLAGDVAFDLERVPAFGMADIVDRDVVMLAPEERHGGEILALAQHVARRVPGPGARHHPMLHADGRRRYADRASARYRPPPGCRDRWFPDRRSPSRRGRAQARLFPPAGCAGARPRRRSPDRPQALAPLLSVTRRAIEGGGGVFQMEDHAMFFMQRADEAAHLRPQHLLHRDFFRRDDMDFDTAGPQATPPLPGR